MGIDSLKTALVSPSIISGLAIYINFLRKVALKAVVMAQFHTYTWRGDSRDDGEYLIVGRGTPCDALGAGGASRRT